MVDGIDHFTPGSGSVHCTAVRVCTLSSERERDGVIFRIRSKKTLSEILLLLVIMSKISGILKGSTKSGKDNSDWMN